MKSWTEDLVVILIILIATSFLGFTLYQDFNDDFVEGEGEVVAVLSVKESRVQRNGKDSQMWNSLRTGAVIYNYDTIRTDSSATAQVKIFARDEEGNITDEEPFIVNLGSNVMVTIVANETNTLDVAVRDLKEGRDPTQATRLQMDSGEIYIGQDGMEQINIELVKGKGQILGQSEVIKLIENQMASVDDSGRLVVGGRPLSLIYPVDMAMMAYKGSELSVPFKWKFSKESQDNNVTLQLSTGGTFKTITQQHKVKGDSFKLELGEGIFYWRLVQGDTISPVRKIFIQRENQLELVTPSKKAVTYFEDIPRIFFRWRGAEMSRGYLLAIYEGSSSDTPIFKKLVNENSYIWKPKKEGTYRWKITPRHFSGGSEESQDQDKGDETGAVETYFSIKKLTTPPPPTAVSPALGKTLPLGHQLSNISFIWKGHEAFDQYALQVASDSSFSKMVANVTTEKQQALVSASWEKGETYFWRVLAGGSVDGRNLREQSSVATFSFEAKPEEATLRNAKTLPPPTFTYPRKSGFYYIDERPYLDFKWKDMGDNVTYKISIYNTITNDPVFIKEGIEENTFRFDKITKLSRDKFYAELEASRYTEATNSNEISDVTRIDFTVTLRYVPKAPRILEGAGGDE